MTREITDYKDLSFPSIGMVSSVNNSGYRLGKRAFVIGLPLPSEEALTPHIEEVYQKSYASHFYSGFVRGYLYERDKQRKARDYVYRTGYNKPLTSEYTRVETGTNDL